MLTGVMFAMPEEGQALVEERGSGARTVEHGRRAFHFGKLWGADVVLVQARIGKVAAATTTTELITRFQIDRLLFTGLAGGVAPGVNIGDLVVADRLVQHDLDASPIFPPMEIPLLGVREISTDPDLTRSLVSAGEVFLRDALARDLSGEDREKMHVGEPTLHTGLIATGDRFVSSDAERDAIRVRTPAALCVEMEGAAAAQVAHEYAIPFAIARVISDSADDHAATNFPDSLGRLAAAASHGVLERFFNAERHR
ncbi:MAG: 5'-methylthioadenosine/adenosylhomocysteine nucleosidase [Phycisphaerales bacterium JB059]